VRQAVGESSGPAGKTGVPGSGGLLAPLTRLNRIGVRAVVIINGRQAGHFGPVPGGPAGIRKGLRVDGRLMADLGRIRQVSSRLGWVEREFSDASQFTDSGEAFLGSADLESAMAACVTGWSQQRTALISQLSNVARLSALAASSYEKTDAELTAVLRRAMNNGSGG
jgi:hypothetical protein